MQKASALTLISLGIILSGCGGNQAGVKSSAAPLTQTGFLANYSKLTTNPNYPNSKIWTNPKKSLSEYQKITLDPVVYWLDTKGPTNSGTDFQNDINRVLKEKITHHLGSRYEVVDTGGPGVVRLSVAVTGVAATEKGFQAYNIIPIGLAIYGIQKAGGTRPKLLNVSFEAKLVDSLDFTPIVTVVERQVGDEVEEKASMASVEPILDNWAKRLRKALDSAHGQ